MGCVNHQYIRKVVNGELVWACPNCHGVSSLKPLPSYEELLKENADLKQKVEDLEDKLKFFVELNYGVE